MKYKLSDKLNAFLTDNVLPEHKGGIEKNILDSFGESDILIAKMFSIDAKKTVYGIEFSIALMRSDLVEIEPLKTNVWYEAEKFDGNPNKYLVVEIINNETVLYRVSYRVSYCPPNNLDHLSEDTTHFMYIEKPNK